jgi:hypothetical protein
MGNVYLLGQDSDMWAKPEVGDMIVLKARPVDDSLSRFVTDKMIHWYHRILGRRIRVRSNPSHPTAGHTMADETQRSQG